VSVSVSSLVPTAVGQSPPAVGELGAVPEDLLVALGALVDPRGRRGVRHRLVSLIGVAVCAVLAGARSYVSIAEWTADLTPTVRARLKLGRRVPSESTIRRVLQRVDAQQLDQLVSGWLVARTPAPPGRPVIAVDGKTARGARCAGGRAVHLLAAFATGSGVVLGQSVVAGKTNEISAFAPLLDRIELSGALVTADALHTQRAHCHYLIGRGGHFLLTVKANQPTLLGRLRGLPWADIPVADRTSGHGHGRAETRTIKLTEVPAGIGFPHARTVLQIIRRTRRAGRRWHTETVYAITDLTVGQANPAELADALRSHWHIENRLHWVRDVTFTEDLSQIRTGNGPAVMATLRNLAISLHRLVGASNIAAATRHLSRHPNLVPPLIMPSRMNR